MKTEREVELELALRGVVSLFEGMQGVPHVGRLMTAIQHYWPATQRETARSVLSQARRLLEGGER